MSDFKTKEEHIAYLKGMIAGIELYAIWKNGEQVVGIMEIPLWKVTQIYSVKIEQLQNS